MYQIIKNPVSKITSLFAKFDMIISTAMTHLNPIQKHSYLKYQSTAIGNQVIVTHHIEILKSKMSNLQTILNPKVSNSISNYHLFRLLIGLSEWCLLLTFSGGMGYGLQVYLIQSFQQQYTDVIVYYSGQVFILKMSSY